MGVYAGIRRAHVHNGSQLPFRYNGCQPKRDHIPRQSRFASIETDSERRLLQTEEMRAFTDDPRRRFVSDATLTVPHSSLRQVARAIHGPSASVEPYQTAMHPRGMVHSNRFEELPEWMGRMQTLRAEPTARQRVAELQHHDEARRLQVEASAPSRKLAGQRMRGPQRETGTEDRLCRSSDRNHTCSSSPTNGP